MAATEPLIEGALITRVDRPIAALYVLSLASPGGNVCLALAGGPPLGRPAIAFLRDRPRGEPADGEVRGLREKLESGRVQHVSGGLDDGGWELIVERGALRYLVRLSSRGLSVTPTGASADHPAEPGEPLVLTVQETAPFVAAHDALLLEAAKRSALRAIDRAKARLVRRMAAIAEDGVAVAEAEAQAARARLFVGAARNAPRHARELVATDWSSGEAVEIRFALRGDEPAHAELEAVFHRAKRLRGGAARAAARTRESALAVEMLADTRDRVGAVVDRENLERELARLQRALPGDIRLERTLPAQPTAPAGAGRSARAVAPARRSYRAFVSSTGIPILVGKGGADNDELTLRVARPQDHFFHAKDAKGAHVIAVAPNKSAPLDPRVLVEGALLAAHFSDQRGEAVVDVQHCARRHLRKRKGAPPGLVELSQEKVIAVRSDEAVLARLLASEDRG